MYMHLLIAYIFTSDFLSIHNSKRSYTWKQQQKSGHKNKKIGRKLYVVFKQNMKIKRLPQSGSLLVSGLVVVDLYVNNFYPV